MALNGIYITIQVMGDSKPYAHQIEYQPRTVSTWFFYIENFLHEADFETILPIMLDEYHCGC